MFFFSEESEIAGEIMRTIASEARRLGHGKRGNTDWYDTLYGIDRQSIQSYRLPSDEQFNLSWSETLVLIYRLFLGRFPERDRFTNEPKALRDLICEIVTSSEFRIKTELLKFLRGAAFNRQRKLIFLHCPRSAGTSLGDFLRRVFWSYFEGTYEIELQPVDFLNLSAGKCIGGHLARELYSREQFHDFLSVVRTPQERMISRALFYYDRYMSHLAEEDAAREMMEFAPFRDELRGNFQTRFVLGEAMEESGRAKSSLTLVPFNALGEVTAALRAQFGTGFDEVVNKSRRDRSQFVAILNDALADFDWSVDQKFVQSVADGWSRDRTTDLVDLIRMHQMG